PRHFERAEDVLGYFDSLCSEEIGRLGRCGLRAQVALGVLPSAVPRRAHFEVWRELPYLLRQPEVVALGEVGVWADEPAQWELFERQIKIVRDMPVGASKGGAEPGGMPVICTPPDALRVNMTYKMMQH